MAMVQLRKEDALTNEDEVDENCHISEENKTEESTASRSSSRNSNSSKRGTPVSMPRHQYSKDELIDFSKLPLSLTRPDCLDLAHNNSGGKWDPENWFLDKRGDKAAPVDETRLKRTRPEIEAPLAHKRRTSDPRERVKEEKDEIILSPQRRSFGTGCHVIQHSAVAKRPGSPSDMRDNDNFRERRIGSGRIVNRDRDQREWERDHRDYNYSGNRNDRRDRFDQDENEKDSRRYSGRYGRDRRMRGHERIDEEEPEWFSGGPTSQSETIELVGFEDPSNEGETKKPNKKAKKSRDNARKHSLKSEDEEKMESATENKPKRANHPDVQNEYPAKDESRKKIKEYDLTNGGVNESKPQDCDFNMGDVFNFNCWMPGFLPNESSHNESTNAEIANSRFSQWFSRDSPVPEGKGSAGNSRRSSFHEESFLSHILGGIAEPGQLAPSPTICTSDSYFAPISPALRLSPGCSILPPHSVGGGTSRNFLEMLQLGCNKGSDVDSAKFLNNEIASNTSNIKEIEAGLKKLVLEKNQPQQDTSAFDKLFQNMQDVPSSISIGPLDKSKVLQEEDLLQNILGHSAPHSTKTNTGNMVNHVEQPCQPTTNDIFNMLQPQRQFEIQQQQGKPVHPQIQPPNKHLNKSQDLSMDILSKMMNTQPHGRVSPVPPHQFTRNEAQTITALMQQHQRQRDIMNSIMKQQQQQQQLSQRAQIPPLMHPMKAQMNKDLIGPATQTLGLPTLATHPSPLQSPLPPEALGTGLQGRVPSPLIFGQQPPALSHAPAPIHPNHIGQALPQSPSNGNTLQVQNAVVLQRVPSPQELAVHTQSILQNALIKRKLEEQKENFRKRQEAKRTSSPVINRSGNNASPQKVSPAFTPTSVMRKMQSEKNDGSPQRQEQMQNGSMMDSRIVEMQQNPPKPNNIASAMSGVDIFSNNLLANEMLFQQSRNGTTGVPRPVYGQCTINPPRPQHSGFGLNANQSQGRPIVKGGTNQMVNPSADMARASHTDMTRASQGLNKTAITNKMFPMSNNQIVDRDIEAMNKLLEQQRLIQQQQKNMMAQRRQNSSPMPTAHATANTKINLISPLTGLPINIPGSNIVRPVNVGAIPYLRTAMQTPAARAAQPLNQMPISTLNHLTAMQLMQRASDNRQIASQARNFHPAFNPMLLNSQAQGTNQPQPGSGMMGAHGDGKHSLLGQNMTSSQSPSNLTKWFGNDVLKQKMPDMPPISGMLLEDVERQGQPTHK